MLDGKHADDLVRFPYATSISIGPNANGSAAPNTVAIGHHALFVNTTGTINVAAGSFALTANTSGERNTAVGYSTLANNTAGINNTALGYVAGRYNVSGGDMVSWSNVTCIGSNSRVSGANQLQLGDSTSDVYSQSAVKTRSDERDKLDIQSLTYDALDFILGLRPVQYRQNPRERYDGELNNDGSQAGKRLHNGFIAQEVAAHAENMGFDFAGWQDHTINDGCDVQSLAYEQFVAPLVGAIQMQQEIIEKLTKRLEVLETRN